MSPFISFIVWWLATYLPTSFGTNAKEIALLYVVVGGLNFAVLYYVTSHLLCLG